MKYLLQYKFQVVKQLFIKKKEKKTTTNKTADFMVAGVNLQVPRVYNFPSH